MKLIKKISSLAIAATLVLGCTAASTFSTFAQAEEKELTSINITKLPDKLVYTDEDFFLDADIDENETDFNKISEALKTAVFTFEPDITGIELEEVFSDGTVDELAPNLCQASVADPVKYSEIMELIETEDESNFDKLMDLIYREYTVNVEFKGISASYKVSVEMQEYDPKSEIYEFVSYGDLVHKVYSLENDVYDSIYVDDEGNEIPCQTLDFDLTGMTVILKNTETGELETFGEEDIYIEFYNLTPAGAPRLTAGSYYALGEVWTDDGFVPFSYEFTLVSEKSGNNSDNTDNDDKKDDNSGNNGNDDKNSVGDDDNNKAISPATSDSTDQKGNTTVKADNNAIQTGNPVSTAVFAVLLLSGALVVFLTYRKMLLDI